ncbi:hypothetical protein D0T84_19710 [Dysgonomonas sp. 521]|uniref:hypothetical protein n=1 Tax=Dysgonomonas sp. 521 TaxID=2302932 RepID=UPI0013D8DB08|nr:hypothetical protein [Dysgonomonas sp. 521]NDV97110.1 hypothetical protein [Dysgonomonas sp. 521]
MRTIYTEVMKRLQTEVPALSGIELDSGQLKLIEKEETLPVTLPYALIDISIPECSDITDKTQSCNGIVGVTLVFESFDMGKTSSNRPDADRDLALTPFDVISDVYKALQGYESVRFNTLSRISQGKVENEFFFVYKINFACEFEDLTALLHL